MPNFTVVLRVLAVIAFVLAIPAWPAPPLTEIAVGLALLTGSFLT